MPKTASGKPAGIVVDGLWLFLCSLAFALNSFAANFPYPPDDKDSVIGEIQTVEARKEDTLVDIARRADIGYDEIVKANPGIDRWLPGEGTKVTVPNQFVLPDTSHEGIVLNLGELRLFYFPPAKKGQPREIYSYPVSVGRMDWRSPLGKTKIEGKEKDPAWHPPKSIKAEHEEEGDILPDVIPGGSPDNPLGKFALRLGIKGYLIHGTDERKENGIGMRVTHGCVRMYPEDIEQLYNLVSVNTPVMIVDQPIKIGWKSQQLYGEAHAPLEEDREEFEAYSHRINVNEALSLLTKKGIDLGQIDTQKLTAVVEKGEGIPLPIGPATFQ